MKSVFFNLLILLLAALFVCGCAAHGFRFADADPVWDLHDRTPGPMPHSTRYIRADYYFKVLVRRPAVKIFDYAPLVRSKDVNSLDHVPASSWYTPRMGYQSISPAEILNGLKQIGPPVLPVRVVRAKHTGLNPGFVIADSRDLLYLVKFDPPNFPAVETTTALIVNRLFWAFGYNVPEDYTFYFNSTEVPVDSTADISEAQVKLVFGAIAPPVDGRYRATASLLIDGIYLGPIGDTGTRKGDPNDLFPHEDRRILRALKVFGAFTNQTDIRIDNSLDVFEGEQDKGYVKHYLLDFGEALGAHGTSRGRLWDGFTHVFSFRQMFNNFATLGLKPHDWENVQFTPWKSVGTFEAKYFDPLQWKEAYPFAPIQRAQADDCYWAAKIIAALTREHLAALIEAADYPEPGAAEYVLETLMQRRQKVIDAYFGTVSPIEYISLDNSALRLEDFGKKYQSKIPKTSYEINFYNDGKNMIAPTLRLEETAEAFSVPLTTEMLRKARGYLRVTVRVWRGNQPAPRAAEFHIRQRKNNRPRLAGVVH